MWLLDGLAELLFPTRCAGCESPGDVVCRDCFAALPRIAAAGACPRCGAPYGALVCTECWEREWAFEAALAVGNFEAPLARMVALHKDAGERRLAQVLGQLIAAQVMEMPMTAASAQDQRALGRIERASNVAGTFATGASVSGRVLLCDDVFTTGATLDAAAQSLLEAGARAVRCAAVARVW